MVNAAKTKSQNESCVQIYTMYVIVILGLDLKWFSLVNAAEIGVYRMACDTFLAAKIKSQNESCVRIYKMYVIAILGDR